MEPIIKKTIEKKVELDNYCNTKHDFFEIFPSSEYDFTGGEYLSYFYFDTEEARLFLDDLKVFVVRNYRINMFRIGIYYDIIKQFEKYLVKHRVFYFNRTMVGISMSINNPSALYRILSVLDPKIQVNDKDDPLVFAFGEVDGNKEYNLQFFNYLESKLKGYNYSKKYIIEPLLACDINSLKSVFKGEKYSGELPFFINPNYKNVKSARAKLIADFIDEKSEFAWCVSTTNNDEIIALVNIVRDGGTGNINILCNSSYYDLDFKEVIKFVSYYAVNNLGFEKLVCFNDNVELSYSTINSSLTVAGYKPNYLQETGEKGYSKIEYSLKKSDYEFETMEENKLVIRFNF